MHRGASGTALTVLVLSFVLSACSSGGSPGLGGGGGGHNNSGPAIFEIVYPVALKDSTGLLSSRTSGSLLGMSADAHGENFSRAPFPIWDLYTLEGHRRQPSALSLVALYRAGALPEGTVVGNRTTILTNQEGERGVLTVIGTGEDLRVWYEAAEAGGRYRLSGFDTQSGWGVDINHTFCVAEVVSEEASGCNRSPTEREFGMFGVREVGEDLQVFYLSNSVGTFGFGTAFEELFPTAQTFIAQGNDEMSFVRYSYRTFFGPSPSDRRVEFQNNAVDSIWDVFAVAEAGGGQLVFHRQVLSDQDYLSFTDPQWNHEAAALRHLVVSSSDESAFVYVDYAAKQVLISASDAQVSGTDALVGDLIIDFGYTCGPSEDFTSWGGPFATPERCPLVSLSPTDGAPQGLRFELPHGLEFGDVYTFGLDAIESLKNFDLRLEDPFVEGSPLPGLIDDEVFSNGMRKERWAELWFR